MEIKIWSQFLQILIYRNDLCDILKSFMENLNNHNINDEKYIPYLQSFSKYHFHFLHKNGIISVEKLNFLLANNQNSFHSSEKTLNIFTTLSNEKENQTTEHIKKIIGGDQVEEFGKFIEEKDISNINSITQTFLEVETMKVPLIQYCVMKKAIKCFKYLLVNGLDDPNKLMEEQNPKILWDFYTKQSIYIKRYEWDCIATAIYFRNKEMIKILDERGLKKVKNPEYIEAAVLSYANLMVKEILEEMNEKNDGINDLLKKGLLSSSKNNNIKGAEILMSKGIDINIKDIN